MIRTGEYRALVARALAAAFLDGEWTQAGLTERGTAALGARPRWLSVAARSALKTFPTRPTSSVESLEARILELPSFQRAIKSRNRPIVRRYFTFEPQFGAARWPVPAIATVGELAKFLGISIGELAWLADPRGLERDAVDEPLRNYGYHWQRKPSGGARLVESPKPRLKQIQRRILRDLLDHIPPHDAAHGFRPGRSVLTHIAPHVGREVVVRIDLADFFSSIRFAQVRAIFQAAGYPRPVASTLAALCTNRTPSFVLDELGPPRTNKELAARHQRRTQLQWPHLPQGAPTSPALANLCAFGLDTRLTGLAARAGAHYTRYADDLTFSGGDELRRSAHRFHAEVGAIAIESGFTVNFRKTRIMRASVRQRVTGVVVNQKPNLARVDWDRLKAILTNCIRHGAASQDREGHRDFRAFLDGKVAWVETLNPTRGRKLRDLFNRIEWT